RAWTVAGQCTCGILRSPRIRERLTPLARYKYVSKASSKGASPVPRLAHSISASLCLCIAAAAVARADAPVTQPASKPAIDAAVATKVAAAFADDLSHERFEAAVAPFNKRMRSAIDADKLKETWIELSKQFGEFQSFGSPKHESIGDSIRFVFPGKW